MLPSITSPKNPRVAEVAALRERKERLRQGLFVIEGVREIARAAAAGIQLKELFVCSDVLSVDGEHFVRDVASCPTTTVSEKVFAKLAMRQSSDGLLAVAHVRAATWQMLPRQGAGLVFVLEGVEKPGNLGAFLRSADGAGVDMVIVLDDSVDLYNPNVVRASVGAVFSVPTIWSDHAAAYKELHAAGYDLYAADPDATDLCFKADLTKSSAIILGSEAHGLSDFWQQKSVRMFKLPMLGKGDSLNVATTGAILAYEARRQRLLLPE